MRLEDLFPEDPFALKGMVAHLKKTADSLGLPLGELKRTCNSRRAQEMGLWAESMGKGEAFHQALFRAFFVDGKNLATVSVLVDLAVSAGLPADEALEVLEKERFKEAVDRDWALARELEVKVIPTFMMGHEKQVGAQSYERLEHWMKSNGVARKQVPWKNSTGSYGG